MSMSIVPTESQITALKQRLWYILNATGPDHLAQVVQRGLLKEHLGPEFTWVCLPVSAHVTGMSIFGWPREEGVYECVSI